MQCLWVFGIVTTLVGSETGGDVLFVGYCLDCISLNGVSCFVCSMVLLLYFMASEIKVFDFQSSTNHFLAYIYACFSWC